MDDRSYFATLVLAQRLGIVSREQVIASADQRIVELDHPDYWLIEISMNADSDELRPLIEGGDEAVYKGALRIAYQAWIDGSISDQAFGKLCGSIWEMVWRQVEHYVSSEWDGLSWIDDAIDLAAKGIYLYEDYVKDVRDTVEKLLEK